MIKRILHFGNPGYLSLKDRQLAIDLPHLKTLDEKDGKKSVPIEDIGIVVLDHPQITITHGCMEALLENNAAIIVCDKSHHPAGLLLPMEGHKTQSEHYKHQLKASLPLKKQLWQQTAQAKILNQAAVLAGRGIDTENMLYWARSVRPDDPDNYEGRAAAFYWRYVFPLKLKFVRDRLGEPPNNLLNYGYAILRAITARALVSSGLLTTLGIHHHNKYNAYCLADDIMEPYRPYVDQLVLQIVDNGEDFTELSNSIKAQLLGIASVDVQFEKNRSPLMVGIQNTTASLAKCFAKETRKITYPLMRNVDGKRLVKYKAITEGLLDVAAEEEVPYQKASEDEKEYPF
jgi:CRISPR-associated protein Cas1